MNKQVVTTPADSRALRLRRIGIDTYQEPVIYMRDDCHVCRSEGFEAQSRIVVRHHSGSIIATLNVVTNDLLSPGEAGLSEAAWTLLQAVEGDSIELAHAPQIESLGNVRAKLYGRHLDPDDYRAIVNDIAAGRYSDMDLSAGLELHAPVSTAVDAEQPLYTLHAETRGELEYALEYVRSTDGIINVEGI